MKNFTQFVLLALLTASQSIHSQSISYFMGQWEPDSEIGSGIRNRTYYPFTLSSGFEHTSGADQNWEIDASGWSETTTMHYEVNEATPETISAFPGTAYQVAAYSNMNWETSVGGYYLTDYQGPISLTGFSQSGLTFKYDTNNAVIGTFPMNFGDSQTDDVAGTFTFSTFTGTFTGTITTEVDAYGTMTFNWDGPTVFPATRLKIVQNLEFSAGIFTGTIVQTNYYYYSEESYGNWPEVKTSQTIVNIPSINYTQNVVLNEKSIEVFLDNQDNDFKNVTLSPIPAKETLHINGITNFQKAEVFSQSGQKLFETNTLSVPVTSLSSGFYLIKITDSEGRSSTKKFIRS